METNEPPAIPSNAARSSITPQPEIANESGAAVVELGKLERPEVEIESVASSSEVEQAAKQAADNVRDAVIDQLEDEPLLDDLVGKHSPKRRVPVQVPGWPQWRNRLRLVIQFPSKTKLGSLLQIFFRTIVLLSVLSMIVETIPGVRWPPEKAYKAINALDATWTAVFTLELFLHFMTMTSWKYEFFTWWTFVDVMSCLPYYLTLIVIYSVPDPDKNVAAVDALRLLRLFRIIRLAKLGNHNTTMRLLYIALANSSQGILSLLIGIPLLTIFWGMVFYTLESFSCYMNDYGEWRYKDTDALSPFQSALDGIWFAIETLSTVGFGDIVVATWQGRAATYLAILSSMFILAFPLAIINAAYTTVLDRYRERTEKAKLSDTVTLATLNIGNLEKLDQSCMDVRVYLGGNQDYSVLTKALLELQKTGLQVEVLSAVAPDNKSVK